MSRPAEPLAARPGRCSGADRGSSGARGGRRRRPPSPARRSTRVPARPCRPRGFPAFCRLCRRVKRSRSPGSTHRRHHPGRRCPGRTATVSGPASQRHRSVTHRRGNGLVATRRDVAGPLRRALSRRAGRVSGGGPGHAAPAPGGRGGAYPASPSGSRPARSFSVGGGHQSVSVWGGERPRGLPLHRRRPGSLRAAHLGAVARPLRPGHLARTARRRGSPGWTARRSVGPGGRAGRLRPAGRRHPRACAAMRSCPAVPRPVRPAVARRAALLERRLRAGALSARGPAPGASGGPHDRRPRPGPAP